MSSDRTVEVSVGPFSDSSDEEIEDTSPTSSEKQKLRLELIEFIVKNSEKYNRGDVEKWSMFYLKRTCKKLQLPRDDYLTLKEYSEYRQEKDTCEDRPNDENEHEYFDISVEDARRFLAEENVRLREANSLYGQTPAEDEELHILLRRMWNVKSVMQRDLVRSGMKGSDVREFSDKELVEKHAIYNAEKEARMEAQRLENARRPYLRKLFAFSQSYLAVMPDENASVDELKDLLSKVEEDSRALEKKRNESYAWSMQLAIDSLIEKKPDFAGVFGDVNFDDEIYEVFSVLDLHDMFSCAHNAIPSVDDIMNDTVDPKKKLQGRDRLAAMILMFNGMVAGRGRFACRVTNSSYLPCGFSNGHVDNLRVKMFLFVLKEMLKNGDSGPHNIRHIQYAKMTNEIELFVLCSSTGGDGALSIYNNDPRVMTDNVKRFVKFVELPQENPYVEPVDMMKNRRGRLDFDENGPVRPEGCIHQ
jgi:hypothetical protein